MCPELPQQPVSGGIELSGFPKPPIAPGAAAQAGAETGEDVGRMATDLGVRLLELRRTQQFNEGMSENANSTEDLRLKILNDPAVRNAADPQAAAQTAFKQGIEPIQ